jgi:transcriptional regulator with XRE-family HTH domain
MLDKYLSMLYDGLMMGNRLKAVLKREGVTAYRLWKDLGIHQSQLSKFFHGKVNISLEMLEPNLESVFLHLTGKRLRD